MKFASGDLFINTANEIWRLEEIIQSIYFFDKYQETMFYLSTEKDGYIIEAAFPRSAVQTNFKKLEDPELALTIQRLNDLLQLTEEDFDSGHPECRC